MALAPDGHLVLFAGREPVHALDLVSRRLVTLEGHSDPVAALTVTPDGALAVSGSSDKSVRVWSLARCQCVRTFPGLPFRVRAVAATPCGRYVVAASANPDITKTEGSLHVWDLQEGECVRTLDAGPVIALSLTRDGRFIVVGSTRKAIQVWDLAQGEVVASYQVARGVRSCAVAPDGTTIVAGDQGGGVHFLRLQGSHPGVPWVTPARLWHQATAQRRGWWSEEVRWRCPRCAQVAALPPVIDTVVQEISGGDGVGAGDAPCLDLPRSAWDDSRLDWRCRHCRYRVRFTPFVVNRPKAR
jgi:hypothetical protein